MPRVMNPVNKFFKEITRLEKTIDSLGDGPEPDTGLEIWPFRNSSECNPDDCFKRLDGLWQKKTPLNTGMKDYAVIFLWREHPNYCIHGQPCYTADHAENFRRESEDTKILVTLEYDGHTYEFIWGWREVVMPTKNIWGMKMGPTAYELWKDKECIHQTGVKKDFKEFWNEIYQLKAPPC